MAGRLRTPLGQVYGLGSAREGVRDWWLSRLTSIALVPLGLWWVGSIILHAGADYRDFTAWVRSPVPAILLIVTLAVTFWHIALGLQVVIEDYIHDEGAKLAAIVAVKFAAVLLGVAGVFSVLRIALGG